MISKITLGLVLIFSISTFAKNPLYKVKIKAKNSAERTQIASIVHMDLIDDEHVIAVVNKEDLRELRRKISKSRLEITPILDLDRAQKSLLETPFYEFPTGDEQFHTYEELNEKLVTYAQSPFAELVKLGESLEGRDILGLKISVGLADSSSKPALMIMGTHHAREHLSTEVSLLVLGKIIERISNDRTFRAMMEQRTVYAFPLINPDGALHDIKDGAYKYWRKNRRKNDYSWFGGQSYGVDLNRNYSFGWGGTGSSDRQTSDIYRGPAPFSEPETQAVKSFVETHRNISTMISFHTFSELILYPWGHINESVPGDDGKVFRTLAEKMATYNGYRPMASSGLYLASGDTCDWAYGEFNIFCFTFELTPKSRFGAGGFYPGAQVIDSTLNANVTPVMYLIDKTLDPYSVL